MAIDLGDGDVGMAVLYKERVNVTSNDVYRVANLVLLRVQHLLSRSAKQSPGNHSWMNKISALLVR